MTAMRDRSDTDILDWLWQLAGRVSADEHAEPELRVFEAAATEIERLRGQLDRISQLANASFPLLAQSDGA